MKKIPHNYMDAEISAHQKNLKSLRSTRQNEILWLILPKFDNFEKLLRKNLTQKFCFVCTKQF